VRIVIDTNIIVSALITPFGPAARILDMVLSGEVQVLYDDRIITEYREVLQRPKFSFHERDINDLLFFFESEGEKINPPPLDYSCIDEYDMPFLETAAGGMAEAVITGNKRHFKGFHVRKMKILSPDEFLKFWHRASGK
jgi:putative PIN family toxin of toxin-antitoxin system